MHWEKLPSSEQSCRPYQGVRVKDPVKELLRRKRGAEANKPTPTTAVVVPNSTFSSHPQIGASGFVEAAGGEVLDAPAGDGGAVCTGWIAQPTATTLQPLTQWPCPDYMPFDPNSSTFSTDMYVQPVCPSYTVVGPSSVLTYTHAPLFTNFGPRAPTPAALPQVDLPDASVTYIPWPQPLATLTTPTVQCPPGAAPFAGPQLVSLPLPVSVPEPDPERLEQARATVASLPLERLLEEDDDKDTYVTGSSLFTQGV
ncbi:POU domain class 2-associating factor 1 [Megalops cyprinoides]|uniref:POU domain class 2-associating factor 1 n=1 Tax=Megalops cyprinoides TaxID=118141 RepID=UPI001864D11C|nr:POU domain class 2-associating factor 1 [Megalops cyprinoides]